VVKKNPKLKPGDKVGLIAPASPQKEGEEYLIEKGISVLEEWGLQVIRQQGGYTHDSGYLAGDDEYRARQFSEFYTREDIRAIFITRGGYGCGRMVPLLDHPRLARQQKIVVGFSDATFLLLYLQKSASMVYHGPGIATSQFVEQPKNQQSLRQFLFEADYFPVLPIEVLRPGRAEGLLTGGCLSIIVTSLATPWEIDTHEKILFIEDVNEDPFRIDRMISHLKNAGKFDRVRGIVFGEMTGCLGNNGELWGILEGLFCQSSFPVAYNLPCGHGKNNLTLALGSPVVLDHKNLRFQI